MRPNVIFTAFLQLFVKQSVQFRIECAVQTCKVQYFGVGCVHDFVALLVGVRQRGLLREGVQLEIAIACRLVAALHCRCVDTHCGERTHCVGNVVARRVDDDVTPVVVVKYSLQSVAAKYAVEQRLQVGLLQFAFRHFVDGLLELVHGGTHQHRCKHIDKLVATDK